MADPGGTRIVVPADLEASGSSIMAIATQIEAQLTALWNQLAPLQEIWTGGSSLAYQDLQKRWNTAAQNLMTGAGELGAISQAATTNWNNYVDCETTNTASWASNG
jgi:WXG100 family type VII secretion target